MILPVSFQAKRILVTGAGGGLGKELVKCLVQNKATVFALSKTKSKLDELKQEFPQITTVQADVENWDETRSAVKNIGTIHGLVNNAGVNIAGRFLQIKPEDFDKTFNANLKSVLNISQVVLEDMVKRNEGGSIVNISSVGVRAPSRKQTTYTASKAAVMLFSKSMSNEMGKYNIRVNTVNPGLFASGMSKATFEHPTGRFYTSNMENQHLKRILTTEEVANTILFLLSDYSSGITGQEFFVDCGFSA